MSSAAMALKGRLVGIKVLAERNARASERGRGPVVLPFPGIGRAYVVFRTYGAMELAGVSSKVGLVTGLKVSAVREIQRSQLGVPHVLAFVDYIVREVLWARIDDLVAPDEFLGLDGRGSVRAVKLPIEHNNFGHDQFLWPVDWFPNRKAIPLDLAETLWAERTHISERGAAREGWENREFEFQRAFRAAHRAALRQMDLFAA